MSQPNPTPTPAPTTPASPQSETPFRYTALLADSLERKWQDQWDSSGTFVQPNPGDAGFDASRPKFYCLDMFPYPSGSGLHVGHPEGYTATDIICRYKRMKGFNVLHPMGWDAFGLPAEQYAIQTGIHPAITTRTAIDNFRRQLKRFGFSYDWEREFGTIDPGYYKWTQWIFLKLYDAWFDGEVTQSQSHGVTKGKARPISELIEREKALGANRPGGAWSSLTGAQRREYIDARRLAYIGEQTVNWCPKLGTVLANDEVIDGRSERGNYPVLRKPLRQWMFRITAYADRLLDQLHGLDWPSSTKAMQSEWIGRSEGAEIDFAIDQLNDSALRVFTTRPDTLFGATYMVIAPEHPLAQELLARSTDPSIASAVRAYVAKAKNLSDIERMENKKKTGVFSGLSAVNPANGQRIPVWIADYVLMGYGTGAIMAVPAHDERDYEFAKTFNLPIRDVVYDRTRLAMAFFAHHAPAGARTPEIWMGVLADFLGFITSKSTPTAEFGPALEYVFTHRDPAAQGTAMTIHRTAPEDRPGGIGERRGATQVAWLDALVEMGFKSIDDFTEQFTTGRVFETAGEAFTAPGQAVNSANDQVSLNGLGTDAAKARMTQWLTTKGLGSTRVNYKFRDWTFSRQRYWGEPFPIVYTADGTPYPISPSALPVTLPELADYAPIESDDPLPLLAKATNWVNTTAGEAGVDPSLLPPGTPVRRETNTMPGSAGSSWYAVRYCEPKNDEAMVSPEADRYWMGGGSPQSSKGGVDLYLGGSEHAVGHLLYSRFWHNVLHDLGYLSTAEPFQKLFHQGLITSYAFQKADKVIVAVDEVREVAEGRYELIATSEPVTPVVTKMSKRYKNVVNPDDVIAEFGADTFRLYEMYMGPLEASKPWNPRDITGLFRFLSRVWRLAVDEKAGALRLAGAGEPHHAQTEKLLHRMIAKVALDIERLSFNTAIATMIEFVNAVPAGAAIAKDQLERFLLVLAPFAPHIAEELWAKLGHTSCISLAPWPAFDPAMLKDDSVELAVQIQGKVKCKVMVPSDADAAAIETLTLADAEVQRHLAGKSIKKIVVVPGRLVNIVAV